MALQREDRKLRIVCALFILEVNESIKPYLIENGKLTKQQSAIEYLEKNCERTGWFYDIC